MVLLKRKLNLKELALKTITYSQVELIKWKLQLAALLIKYALINVFRE
jgi:hypothetical protein